MANELADTVARGYRVVAATCFSVRSGGLLQLSLATGIVVVLGKLASGDPKPEYGVLVTDSSGTFEREIIAASREGYRVLPMALAGASGVCAVLEKSPSSPPIQYKVLGTSRVSTLRKELTEAAAAGWSVDRLLLNSERVLVLEKPGQ